MDVNYCIHMPESDSVHDHIKFLLSLIYQSFLAENNILHLFLVLCVLTKDMYLVVHFLNNHHPLC